MSVDLTIDRGVVTVTINRPDALNAIDAKTEERLLEVWDELERMPGLRAVVLTGAGDRAFCVGSDVKDASQGGGYDHWVNSPFGGFGGIALRTTLDVPIVARVNGYALGGGFEMMLGCDLVIAAESAEFGLPEPRLGMLPLGGGLPLLVRRIPHFWAMELLLTGKRISSDQAARIGLVNRVVPLRDLDEAVGEFVEDICECGPSAIRAIKQLVNRTAHLSAADAQALRLPALSQALSSTERKEGTQAFAARQKPSWADRE